MNHIAAASGTFSAFDLISRMLIIKRIWTCHMEFIIETSVTKNSLSEEDYSHPDDHMQDKQ